MPAEATLDPELTVGLPADLTAATGMDAFLRCLEGFCAASFRPMADGIAAEGMRLVKVFLHRACRGGGELAARAHMLAAAALGAVACEKGLGGVHALAHPVGALCGTWTGSA